MGPLTLFSGEAGIEEGATAYDTASSSVEIGYLCSATIVFAPTIL